MIKIRKKWMIASWHRFSMQIVVYTKKNKTKGFFNMSIGICDIHQSKLVGFKME